MSQLLPWGRMQGVRPSKPYLDYLLQGLDAGAAAAKMQTTYGVSVEKLQLLRQVGAYTYSLVAALDPRAVSIYVGIPFCPTRCLYCSFPAFSLSALGRERGRFVQALVTEIAAVGAHLRLQQRPIDSVYLGGGTPTALAPADLDLVLTALRRELPACWREFTVEAGRPETLTAEQLAVLSAHGVERISINPQTVHDRTLQAIGRQHQAADVELALARSRHLFPIINMDLILGLPGEGREEVRQSLQWVLGMQPKNITLHMFSPKRASRFSAEQAAWTDQLPSAEVAQAMNTWCQQQLAAAGYHPYYLYRQRNILGGEENTGWAKPGGECRYNVLMIEERQHILGLGVGASSKFLQAGGKLRNLSNPKDVPNYLQRLPQLIADKLEILNAIR